MRLGKQRNESKYLAVKYFYEEKQWSINWMCWQLNISRAAYYKLMLVYKCGQKKLNNLYYQIKEQRR